MNALLGAIALVIAALIGLLGIAIVATIAGNMVEAMIRWSARNSRVAVRAAAATNGAESTTLQSKPLDISS